VIRRLFLLTSKPILFAANVAEETLARADESPHVLAVRHYAETHLGTEAVAVAGYTSQYYQLAQAALLGLSVACVALMSRALGAGDPARARHAFAASLLLAFGAAVVIASASLAFPRQFLELLGASPQIVDRAVTYFRFTLGSSVFFALALTIGICFISRKYKDHFDTMEVKDLSQFTSMAMAVGQLLMTPVGMACAVFVVIGLGLLAIRGVLDGFLKLLIWLNVLWILAFIVVHTMGIWMPLFKAKQAAGH
jgi:hypothetical protein